MAPIVESDGWLTDGRNILSADRLVAIRAMLEDKGPIVVEHWFYRGSRNPDRLVFDHHDDPSEYLATRTQPGDAIWVWDYAALCRDDNSLADGKCPDAQGRTPARGGGGGVLIRVA